MLEEHKINIARSSIKNNKIPIKLQNNADKLIQFLEKM